MAVHGDLKQATRRLDQLHLGVGPVLPDLGRQTDGSGLVVSDDAELDCGAHVHSIAALDTPRHTAEFRRISHPSAVSVATA